METLDYRELKKEFKRKQAEERRGTKSMVRGEADTSSLKDDKLHNRNKKQEYWLYLLEQKSA